MKNVGVQSIGIKLPIIREGDDLSKIVIGSILNTDIIIEDKDVIGITESIVARSQGNYVTIDDITKFMKELQFESKLVLFFPIMSRNRFSLILKAFARYADSITIYTHINFDEVGNPTFGQNIFTGVNMRDYYRELAKSENCELNFTCFDVLSNYPRFDEDLCTTINCMCHPEDIDYVGCQYTLADIMTHSIVRQDGSVSGFNQKYGLLGSNKANNETLKLFPDPIKAQELVNSIQHFIKDNFNKNVEVMVYGDGCFKDPVGRIWEFADPVVSPAYTQGLEGTPNEIKIKAFADDQFEDLRGQELDDAIKETIKNKDKNLIGNMASQGTTPRRYVDLLGSLMDLTSGSGDKGTPVVIVKNYFNKYSD